MHYKTNIAPHLSSDLSWQDEELVQQDSESTVVDSLSVPKVHVEHVHQFTAGQVGDDGAVEDVVHGVLTATHHVCPTENTQGNIEIFKHNLNYQLTLKLNRYKFTMLILSSYRNNKHLFQQIINPKIGFFLKITLLVYL